MSKRTNQAKAARRSAASGKKSPHITKITAGQSNKEPKGSAEAKNLENIVDNTGTVETRPVADPELNQPKKLTRAEKKAAKKAAKSDQERPLKSYFLLFRPFVALGRYLRDSWREIRQVRWPNRKATWKMTLAVLVYVALFMIFLTLIDMLFTFVFDILFKQ